MNCLVGRKDNLEQISKTIGGRGRNRILRISKKLLFENNFEKPAQKEK